MADQQKNNITLPKYGENNNIAIPKGAEESKIKDGLISNSVINKLHLIKLQNLPAQDTDLSKIDKFQVKSVSDLCLLDVGAMQYEPDDFFYCKNFGQPINKLITLRRFPYPCTDNIWDKEAQGEPDIARLVSYSTQEVNKLEDLLSFGYAMKWKELTAEFSQGQMQGDQTGMSGFMKKTMSVIDPTLYNQQLKGENARMLDPTVDQNKVYGPVDSLTTTYIRDIGLTFNKEFDILFEYELKSYNGRTPEYAMKDIMANILAVTYNNGKFWPGARYWVGSRPSKYYERMQYMNSGDMDQMLTGSSSNLKSVLAEFGNKGSAIETLKQAIKGGTALAMSKILDKVGRPGILAMNSLLSGEPTGFWHLTIGNPVNPIMCIGNLICEDVEFTFPTESLSYAGFPTKMNVKVKLKPGQSKDRAGIEMMFNMGKERIYYAPKEVNIDQNKRVSKTTKSFFNFSKKEIDNTLSQTYDFISDGVKSVTKTINASAIEDLDNSGNSEIPIPENMNIMVSNSET